MRKFLSLSIITWLGIAACSPTVKRERVIRRACEFAETPWTPQKINVLHGFDTGGVPVNTPDASLSRSIATGGWWRPSQPARGIPYCWGGFDTPKSFESKLKRGFAAGDVATVEKIHLDNAAVSKRTTGLDCSGFISRCLGLSRHYDTRQLPQICQRLVSYDDLKAGDLLLKKGHVILFRTQASPTEFICYEAGCTPKWRVHSLKIAKTELVRQGFEPWRYRYIRD